MHGAGSPPPRLGLEDVSSSCHHDSTRADLEILSRETRLHSAAAAGRGPAEESRERQAAQQA